MIRLVCDLCGNGNDVHIDDYMPQDNRYLLTMRRKYSLVRNNLAASRSLYLCDECYRKISEIIRECSPTRNHIREESEERNGTSELYKAREKEK